MTELIDTRPRVEVMNRAIHLSSEETAMLKNLVMEKLGQQIEISNSRVFDFVSPVLLGVLEKLRNPID